MSFASKNEESGKLHSLLISIMIGVVAAVSSAVFVSSPIVVSAICLVAVATAMVFRSIDNLTYFVVFMIYANLAVIAVKFHGVPSLAANGVVGLLAVPIAWSFLTSDRTIHIGVSFPWMMGMAIVQFVGALTAELPERSIEDFITYMTEGVFLYLLIMNAVRSREILRGMTWALCLAGCLMGAVPLYQHITDTSQNNYGGLAQTEELAEFRIGDDDFTIKRLAGSIGEKNRFAQVMLMLVPLSLFRLRDEQNSWLRLLALGCLFFALAGVFVTFSRMAIICTGGVFLIAALLNHVSRVKTLLLIAVGAGAILATPQYRHRLATLWEIQQLVESGRHAEVDGALKGRATEMAAAALVFMDHPFHGVGPGEFRHYSQKYGDRVDIRSLEPKRQAHCLPLDVAAENGIPGLVCLIGLFVTIGWCLVSQYARLSDDKASQGIVGGYLYMFLFYFTTGMFLHFAFIRYFWLMIALADSAVRLNRSDR